MSKTLTELTTQIEELEKRIRAISSAQTSLSQILAIRDCIDQIKIYLEDLNTTLSNIEDSASDSELNELKARVSICEEDISAIQTDLATTQDDLSALRSDLNSTNTTVGEHTTTITNLQTTQTNLQTTQSSQASTINNINSRLTTAENNISTLTGGVDVSEIDGRISDLENGDTNPPTCCHKHYNLFNATTDIFYMRNQVYSCSKNQEIYQYFKLRYGSNSTGTLTITVLEDDIETGEIYNVNLQTNPNEFTFFRQFVSTKASRNIQLKLTSDLTISYKSLDFWLFGNNVAIYDNNRDLKVFCYDNNIYVTRYKNNNIYYGKFSNGDDIDLNNLPNTCLLDEQKYANYILFAPYTSYNTSSQQLTKYIENTFHFENAYDNRYYCLQLNDDNTFSSLTSSANITHSSEYLLSNYQYNFVIEIINSLPKISIIDSKGTYNYSDLANKMPNDWLYAVGDIDNFRTSSKAYRTLGNVTCVAKYSDGYFYYITSRTTPQYVKLCKGGNGATAYLQSDGSVNVYINFDTYVKKFNILNKTVTFIETIENCTCVYEVLDTHIIKRDISNNWTIESLS